jgi:hypothetical protein
MGLLLAFNPGKGAHPWQSEPARGRAILRSERIRKRLGGAEAMDEPFPDKPKGMHWNTYNRLAKADEIAQDQWAALCMDWIKKLV